MDEKRELQGGWESLGRLGESLKRSWECRDGAGDGWKLEGVMEERVKGVGDGVFIKAGNRLGIQMLGQSLNAGTCDR